jgi:tetratricopeptide (TPR) repeat protein
LMLIQTDNVARARQVAEAFARDHPESSVGLQTLAIALTADGRLDEGRGAFERAFGLDPGNFSALIGQRNVAVLQERWNDAAAVNATIGETATPFQQFARSNGAAQLALVRGRSAAALAEMDRVTRIERLSSTQRALARNRLAYLLTREGKPALALAQAELAAAEGRNRDSEFESLQLLAIAQAAAGRVADAEKTVALLESRARVLPSDRELRRVHWARGEIALIRGDAASAVADLTRAVSMLPVRGTPVGPPSSRPELLLAAARANIKAGRDAEAAALLERVQAGQERIFRLDSWVRSFYLLGQTYERLGDRSRATAQYRRFLEFWRDGDMERGWVADAEQKTRGQ